MSAFDNIGPHLLNEQYTTPGGGKGGPSVHDYPLEAFLSSDPVDVALAALLTDKSVAKGTKTWAIFQAPYLKAVTPVTPAPPSPPPPPPPAPSGVVWADPEAVLDQGQTQHCIGFGGAQWGNTLPVDDHYTDADGDTIYYACKMLDGEPGQENGSSVHTLAKELKSLGRVGTYAWASTTDAITAFVKSSGDVIVGTDWYNSMFTPDGNGLVILGGGVVGGHCYNVGGWHPAGSLFPFEVYECLNSWGPQWGKGGRFYIAVSDFATLLSSNGEALAAVELT